MRWSWPIGRIAGIPLRVHVTFPILLAWIAFAQWRADRDGVAVLSVMTLILIVFGIVVLHELGHALAARRYGVGTRDITLLPIGGVARLERMPREPRQELVIALAGPAVNVAIALAAAALLVAFGSFRSITDLETLLGADPTFDLRLLGVRLVAINVWLVAFNLLPAFPMDGGRVLRALLAMRYRDHARATDAAAAVGRLFAMVFGAVGLLVVNSPLLVLIAVFVWFAGSGEAAAVRTQAALNGTRVSSMMITDLRVLAPEHTLGRAAQMVIDGFQQDFPVLDGDRYVGMLSRSDLIRGLADLGKDGSVSAVMRRDGPRFEADATPEDALSVLSSAGGTAVPVFERDRLVGLLTAENLSEYLMIRRALRGEA